MRQGLSYFHDTIFASLPVFQRRIDTALSNIGMPKVPLEHNLFRFGSWMGGDRDGNPFVTPETTREVVITARLSAVNLYSQQIEQLMFDLSVWRCNSEVQVNLDSLQMRPDLSTSPVLSECCFPGKNSMLQFRTQSVHAAPCSTLRTAVQHVYSCLSAHWSCFYSRCTGT